MSLRYQTVRMMICGLHKGTLFSAYSQFSTVKRMCQNLYQAHACPNQDKIMEAFAGPLVLNRLALSELSLEASHRLAEIVVGDKYIGNCIYDFLLLELRRRFEVYPELGVIGNAVGQPSLVMEVS